MSAAFCTTFSSSSIKSAHLKTTWSNDHASGDKKARRIGKYAYANVRAQTQPLLRAAHITTRRLRVSKIQKIRVWKLRANNRSGSDAAEIVTQILYILFLYRFLSLLARERRSQPQSHAYFTTPSVKPTQLGGQKCILCSRSSAMFRHAGKWICRAHRACTPLSQQTQNGVSRSGFPIFDPIKNAGKTSCKFHSDAQYFTFECRFATEYRLILSLRAISWLKFSGIKIEFFNRGVLKGFLSFFQCR